MRSFRNLFITLILAAILGAGAFYLHRGAPGGAPRETGKVIAVSAARSPGSAEPAKAPAANPTAMPEAAVPPPAAAPSAPLSKKAGKGSAGTGKADKDNERMHDIPVSAEHPAKGLKIPYFDNEGKLQMIFVIGVATRLDADHIDMADMQVETFDDQQQHEMYIDLPKSVLDLNTSVITTQKRVTIRREDFVLTGESMEFNTRTKQGGLGGSVRMLIYNLDTGTPKPASETPASSPSAAPGTPQADSGLKTP